eukprot:8687200-Pyramimonas_sp.AAC.2
MAITSSSVILNKVEQANSTLASTLLTELGPKFLIKVRERGGGGGPEGVLDTQAGQSKTLKRNRTRQRVNRRVAFGAQHGHRRIDR